MKEIKKPDVTGPRFRPEVYEVLSKDFYKKFKEKHTRYKNIDNTVLKNIIKTFNKTVFQTVIDTRDGVQLPESIGWLFIGTKIKMKNKEFWSFVACREFKRSVAKSYPENWNMYAAIEPNTKIRLTYQKSLKKDYAIKKQNEALETYNEFDL